MSWLILAVFFILNWLVVMVLVITNMSDPVVKWSMVVIGVAALLKWASIGAFLYSRHRGENAFKVFFGRTWDEHVAYRKEMKAYLRDKGILVYDRMLTVILALGVLGYLFPRSSLSLR